MLLLLPVLPQNGGIQIVETPPGPPTSQVVNQPPVAGVYPTLPFKEVQEYTKENYIKVIYVGLTYWVGLESGK